jgi:acyl-CoA thioesterase-1
MSLLRLLLVLSLAVLCVAQPLLANNTAESRLRLLVLGDSLSAGYGLTTEESFPAQLEMALQRSEHRVRVINASVSGDTTAGGLARLGWALADNPHLVIVELGGNDALRGLPPEETFNNLDAILSQLREGGVPVLLAGMRAPRNLGEHYTTAFDEIYPELARQHAISFYPFFLDGVALVPALNQADGIHPNASGVAVIVERILPVVDSVLRSIPK